MSKLLLLLICCLFLVAGCSRPQPQVKEQPQKPRGEIPVARKEGKEVTEIKKDFSVVETEIKKTLQLQKIHPVKIKTYQATQRKRVFDYVTIDGKQYPVPIPWRGRKLNVEPLNSSELKQIPQHYSLDGSKLFLLKKACDALVFMFEKAKEDNITLTVHSGYRSIWYQRKIIRKLMAEGRSWDDIVRYVAPPGYSEHMLGRVVDLYPSNWTFASTSQYVWLKENASLYGFTETYPEPGRDGFPWEPWHWKYNDPADDDYTKLVKKGRSR